MTKRDFEAIARVLDANVADLALVFDFADMCAESNPRFDRPQFVRASTHNLRKQQEQQARFLVVATTTITSKGV